jgi:hypothetical protein
MRLFRRKQQTDFRPNPLSIKFKSGLAALQTNTADWLNGRTMKFNRQQQLMFLVIICLLFGGGSLYLVLKAIL